MKCPKCGHEQTGTVECERCGLIFSKYKPRQESIADADTGALAVKPGSAAGDGLSPVDPFAADDYDPDMAVELDGPMADTSFLVPGDHTPEGSEASSRGHVYGDHFNDAQGGAARGKRISIFRLAQVFFWLVLVIVLVLIIKRPSPPAYQPISRSESYADNAEKKLETLYRSASPPSSRAQPASSPKKALFSEHEINSLIGRGFGFLSESAEAATEGNLTVRDIQFRIVDEEMLIMAYYSVFGKDIQLSIKGTPFVNEQGYFDFIASKVMIGSLPLPAGMVTDALKKAQLEREDLKQALKVPDYIASIRIFSNNLIIETK